MEKLEQNVEKAKNINDKNPWVTFFLGVIAFQKEDYETALKNWDESQDRPPLSIWMKKAFNDVFNPSWMNLHIAHANIEEGNYLDARQMLIEESGKASKENLIDINFLIGLTYVKEASEKPASASMPYYKLAFSYFNRVPMQDDNFGKYKQKVIEQIQKQVLKLIDSQSFVDIPFFISTLQNWNAQAAVSTISTKLIDKLNKEIDHNQNQHIQLLISLLNKSLPPGDVRRSLGSRFEELTLASLKAGDLDSVPYYWEGAKTFQENPQGLTDRFAADIAKQILMTIPQDNLELTKTNNYLMFWSYVPQYPQKRADFAAQLASIMEQLWQKKGEEQKAFQLIRQALSIPFPAQQRIILSSIKSTMQRLYDTAVKENNIDELPWIYSASHNFKLGLDLQNKNAQQQQLERAQNLFQQKEYDEAQKWSEWVLLLEPHNPQALKISGLVAYHKADYKKSLQLLSQIHDAISNQETAEPLVISEILAGNEAKGNNQLKEIEQKQPISQDGHIRLGLGYLIQQKPNEALQWLTSIKDPDSEVYAALTVAAYQRRNWENVISSFHKTLDPYNKLQSLKALVVQAYASLNKIEEAELVLSDLELQIEQPDNKLFPPSFRSFKEKILDPISPLYLAGMFYKEIKKDNEKALTYFMKIENPSSEVLFVRGQTFMNLGQFKQAEKDLLLVVNQKADQNFRKQAIPLLATTYYHLQQYLNAYPWFVEFFKIDPQNFSFRTNYIDVLMQIRRFDLAQSQLAFLKKNDVLSNTNKVAQVGCYVHLNQFEEANALAKILLNPNSGLSRADLFRLGQYLVITNNLSQISSKIADLLKANPTLNPEESRALINFYLLQGLYKNASVLANSFSTDLEENSEGLMVLAQLNLDLSFTNSALTLAYQALEKNPNLAQAIKFISLYENNPQHLVSNLASLDKQLNKNPQNGSLVLEYVQNVITLTNLEHANATLKPEYLDSRYHYSLDYLNKISTSYEEIPQIFYLKGLLLLLADNPKAALDQEYQALRFDPSYSDAYYAAALASKKLKNTTEGITFIKQALKYAPNHAESWNLLSELNVLDNDWEEAIISLGQALKYNPRNVTYYIAMARIKLYLESPEGAKALLEKAIAIDPNNVTAFSLLLQCLYDAGWSTDGTSNELSKQRAQIYQKLHELNPKYAEEVLSQLIKDSKK